MNSNSSICAVVVTFNRLPMLKKTLRYLEAQTQSLNKIIVVDNASSDGTADFLESLERQSGMYEVHRLTENSGGAGGFAYGMRQALNGPFQWIWIMDDDAFTAPDCLHRLLSAPTAAPVRVPIQIDNTGKRYGLYDNKDGIVDMDAKARGVQTIGGFTFVGPLFKRHVVETVGLPRADFFISADDWEYSTRIGKAGFEMVAVAEATINHVFAQGVRETSRLGRRSLRSSTPAWKLYYSSRNELLIDLDISDYRKKSKRIFRHLYNFARLAPGEIFYDDDGFLRLRYRLLGLWDGFTGKTGKRVAPNRIISRINK